MYKLSFTTSGQYISAALFDNKLLGSFIFKSDKGSTSLLIDQINELFKKVDLERKDLSVIYFDNGPGYYTGLRIGFSVAQGVCASLGIPLVPVNGLDALAFAAHTSHRKICSLIDIKRNEFAYCTYNPVPGGVVRNTDPEVISVDNLEIKITSDTEKKLLVGNWNLLNNKKIVNDSNTKLADPKFVTAEHIFNVGERLFDSDNYPNFNEIQIEYMREPDVTLPKENLVKKVNFYD